VKPKRLRLPENSPKRIRTGRERWDSASDILLDRQGLVLLGTIVDGALLRDHNTALLRDACVRCPRQPRIDLPPTHAGARCHATFLINGMSAGEISDSLAIRRAPA
jgi:hypothetical protein